MSLRRLTTVILLTLPFWISCVLGLSINWDESSERYLDIQLRINVSVMIMLIGSAITIVMLVFWLLHINRVNRAQHSRALIDSETAQLRKRFLAQLDHELKNPLTALQATVAYLAEGCEVENYNKAISDISIQVDRLRRLVTDLRKLAELDELEIDRSPVDMAELITEVLEAARGHPGFEERKIHINLKDNQLRLPLILGDRGLLWLACYNLLDNALKFTPAGSTIKISLFILNAWFIIEVADNGPGLSKKDLPHIFEDLYRGDNARGLPGSGLGLALVRSIVSLHQGDIKVRSELGSGTVLTMRLPINSNIGYKRR